MSRGMWLFLNAFGLSGGELLLTYSGLTRPMAGLGAGPSGPPG